MVNLDDPVRSDGACRVRHSAATGRASGAVANGIVAGGYSGRYYRRRNHGSDRASNVARVFGDPPMLRCYATVLQPHRESGSILFPGPGWVA